MNDKNPPVPVILVVEDEKSVLEPVSEAIRDAGMSVVKAMNGIDGLRIALESKPDLILLDLGLPGMDGLTMFSELRRDSWGRTAKVVIFSSTDPDGSILKSIEELRPAYYLVKSSWSLDDVVRRVKELVETTTDS